VAEFSSKSTIAETYTKWCTAGKWEPQRTP